MTHPPHDGSSHRTDDQRTPLHRSVLAILTVIGGVSMIISNLRPRKFCEFLDMRDLLCEIERAVKARGWSARQASMHAAGQNTPELIHDMRRGRVPSV